MQRYIPTRQFLRAAVLLLGSAGLPSLTLAAETQDQPAWIAQSNEHAQVAVNALAKISPEFASQTGVKGYDDKISDLTAGNDERARALLVAAGDELAKRRDLETNPLVRQDLEILLHSVQDQIESNDLNWRLTLPYTDIGRLIFFGEFSLLQDQVEPARRTAAVTRLRRYTGLEPGTQSVAELAKARYLEKAADASLLPPFKNEIEKNLQGFPRFGKGIRDLFTKYGLDKVEGAPAALDAFDAQLKDYEAWVRATVLPKARTNFRLPAELYANNLKQIGLDIPPQELIQKAQLAYAEIRNEMRTLAPLVAKMHGFTDTDYRAVIKALKKDQLTKEQTEPYYREVIGQLEEIIRREKILTLPGRPMLMRLASDAENAASPAPHFQPPPLIGAKNEQGTFVLSTSTPDASGKEAGYDDFTYKAAAWTLAAHEGRPGHDLQFAAMVERGVSLARSLFAFNSVNVEGWALYAEAEAKPYEPIDGQLIALQARLQRAARAFLDPMLNLGLISPERAMQILTEEVCLSIGMATQEVDRYTFRSPGQATAYFYGYTRLMELRTATEITLGPKFDRQAFNDYLIGQGLLPPDLLAKAVREDFVPSQLKK
jgi:hypothetical protein